jgi:hypothetical protein
VGFAKGIVRVKMKKGLVVLTAGCVVDGVKVVNRARVELLEVVGWAGWAGV